MQRRGGYYVAQCPVHDDRTASLSFSQGNEGAVLKCHAGCETSAILDALGLNWSDLFDNSKKGGSRGSAADLWMPCQLPENGCGGHKSAEYRYTDEDGNLLYAVARCSRKGDGCPHPFAQWVPDPSRKYGRKWGLPGDVRRVLYRLPKVIKAAREGRRIWLLEGEKDVERMEADFPDEVATTAMSGAGKSKWRPEYTRYFAGAEVVIVADCDRPGLEYAEEVYRHLSKVVEKVRVVCTPLMEEGADFSDHRDYGFGLDDFEIVPFEPIQRRPPMVIRVEDRHREEPVIFDGFSQASVERSLVGSMLRYGLHYEICEADIRTSEQLRIAVSAINKIAARGGMIVPEVVAAEIENEGKGAYEAVLDFLLKLEAAAFSDTRKPEEAARILRTRSVRMGIAYSCRALEEAARNERWEIEQVLAYLRRMAESHAEEYAELARTPVGGGEFTDDADEVGTMDDMIARIAVEEGVMSNVHELRPSVMRPRGSVVRNG